LVQLDPRHLLQSAAYFRDQRRPVFAFNGLKLVLQLHQRVFDGAGSV